LWRAEWYEVDVDLEALVVVGDGAAVGLHVDDRGVLRGVGQGEACMHGVTTPHEYLYTHTTAT
jgi:hypothetical protein